MYAPLKLGACTAKRTQVVIVDTDPAAHVEIVQQFGDRVWAVLDECDALLAEHMPGKRPCTRSASGNRDAVLRIDTSVSPQCDADPDDVERGRVALFGERDAYMRLMSVSPQAPPGEVELWRHGLQDGAFAERVCVVLQDAACAEHMPADTAHPLARHLRHMLAGVGSRLRMDEALRSDALGDDSADDAGGDLELIESFLREQRRYTEELLEAIHRRGNTRRALGALLREKERYVATTQQHAKAWCGRLQDHPHFVDRAGAGGEEALESLTHVVEDMLLQCNGTHSGSDGSLISASTHNWKRKFQEGPMRCYCTGKPIGSACYFTINDLAARIDAEHPELYKLFVKKPSQTGVLAKNVQTALGLDADQPIRRTNAYPRGAVFGWTLHAQGTTESTRQTDRIDRIEAERLAANAGVQFRASGPFTCTP